jgi:hypothetical protein
MYATQAIPLRHNFPVVDKPEWIYGLWVSIVLLAITYRRYREEDSEDPTTQPIKFHWAY